MRSTDRSAGPLRWLKAALTGLLPTPPTPVQISKGLSLWLDEKRGSRHFLCRKLRRTPIIMITADTSQPGRGKEK